MSTPPESGGQGSGGGWEPGGWQSQWQQPQGDQPWQQQPQPARQGEWQQTPDGQWVPMGGAALNNGKATAALVLGILGLVFCPLVCSIAALVLGYQSRREIDDSGGRMTGRGNAVAGIVLGWVGVGLVVAGVLLIVLLAVFAGGDATVSPAGAPA